LFQVKRLLFPYLSAGPKVFMSNLIYESPLGAFRKIGAISEEGRPYEAVRGISVSATGEHFRFWSEDVDERDDTIDIVRMPATRPDWLETSQGRKFFENLARAKSQGRPVFGTVNKKSGRPDTDGNTVANAAAPILGLSGQPVQGKVLAADPATGRLHVRFSGLGHPHIPATPMPRTRTVRGVVTTAELAQTLAGGDSYIRTKNGQVLGLAVDPRKNPDVPDIIVVGKGPQIESRAALFMGCGHAVPVYVKEATNAWQYQGRFAAVAYKKDAKTIEHHRGPRRVSDIAGILFLKREELDGDAGIDAARRGRGYVDPATRVEIEMKAIEFVTLHYKALGFQVRSVESENLGFDLEADRSGEILNLEVKGTSNEAPRFFISRNERRRSVTDSQWRLAIVSGALSLKPQLRVLTATEAETTLFFEPLSWECLLRP
jgi:hypothetical protein